MQIRSLCQEYLHRHNFKKNLPVHRHRATVFLKSNFEFSNNWRVFSILWREQERHPGFYEINYSNVVHNGIQNNKFLKEIYVSEVWYWDEYEHKLFKFLKNIKKDGFYAVDDSLAVLAAWEIFLIMCDSWLAQNASLDLIKCIEKTINKNLKIEDRILEQQKAQSLIGKLQNSRVNDLWVFQIKPLLKDQNNQWLIDLINE